ncbi:protein WVD2-like 7 [Gastrolobium bilobum]|uniref:protein WVD2-like 7 n=1 Tax=Gastrolobium bilobum TaxID=150636 RepID=UPI002AB11E1D|nr:protein WVD2-like 7 [Gastrolobium bilobum]
MGDSSGCLMQPFCYATGISNKSNPIHALGGSISFGRFISEESLAWEKWSPFSPNHYVEEAERISQPGSVAQKKAFFEAHFKKLAAQKAAALHEQANSATQTDQEHEALVVDNTHNSQLKSPKSELSVSEENAKVLPQSNKVVGAQLEIEHQAFVGSSMLVKMQNQLEDVDNHKELSEKASATPSMDTMKFLQQGSNFDKEVLRSMGRKKKKVSLSKLLKGIRTSKFISTLVKSTAPFVSKRDNIATPVSNESPLSSADKKRSTAKSFHMSLDFTLIREVRRLTATVMRKFECTRGGAGSSMASKASKNELQKHSSFTPLTEKKRNKMTPSNISSMFILRTEERAASRKKKLEKKLNASEAHKVQLHTKLKEKAEVKMRKLRQSFCCIAMPLPDFHKEREASKRETRKDPLTPHESPKEGRSVVVSKSSLPPKRHFQGKNGGTLSMLLTSNSTVITPFENTSPNIQLGNQNDRNYK